jgi:dihydrofolate reductase
MRKLVVYTLLSVDGVAESPDRYFAAFDVEMHANLARVIEPQDTVLLGRRTYDEWANYWPASDQQPFADFINRVPKYVVTSTRPDVPWANTSLVDTAPAEFVRVLKNRPGSDIGVHGSIQLARSLLADGLVDELCLVIAPALAGRGQRLFTTDQPDVSRLELLRSRSTSSGGVLSDYRVTADD